MIRRIPIRWRLSLWYAALTAVVVAVFSYAVYSGLQGRLSTQLDEDLRSQAALAAASVTFGAGNPIIEARDQLSGDAIIWILDTDGRLLLSYRGAHLPEIAPRVDQVVPSAAGYVTFSNASGHGEEVRIISVPIRSGNSDQVLGVLQLGFSTDRVSDPLDLLVQALVVIAPLAIVAAAITGYLLSGRALRPVAEITRLASQIDGEDLGGRLNLALPNDELGRLAATFNSMLGRIDDAFQRQRQFTGDAAHELRTPLALMRSQIDLAMTQADSTADYREALAALDGDVARMTSLVGMLLSLARADAGQLTPNREPVDLADLARDVAEQLDLIAHEHELTITTDLTSVTASVDPDMIIQVLVNLIDNAIKNTPSGGVVTVRLQETDARPPALSPRSSLRGDQIARPLLRWRTRVSESRKSICHIFSIASTGWKVGAPGATVAAGESVSASRFVRRSRTRTAARSPRPARPVKAPRSR